MDKRSYNKNIFEKKKVYTHLKRFSTQGEVIYTVHNLHVHTCITSGLCMWKKIYHEISSGTGKFST